jgi:hypothetical protein
LEEIATAFPEPEAIPRRSGGLLGSQKRSWFHTVETLEAQRFACLDCKTKDLDYLRIAPRSGGISEVSAADFAEAHVPEVLR